MAENDGSNELGIITPATSPDSSPNEKFQTHNGNDSISVYDF